jgi:UDP-N-acetylglucosamine 2-epimerase
MKRIMVICGTRPEAIKMAPLVKRLRDAPDLDVVLCSTGQHREMLDQVMSLFGQTPDIDLGIMRQGQDLIDITTGVMQGLRTAFAQVKPDIVMVHGDTNTTFAATLTAYYHLFITWKQVYAPATSTHHGQKREIENSLEP